LPTSVRRAYRSPLRAKQSRATRERVQRACGRLLRQRGSLEVSIAEVAAAARVAEPTVYRHFPSKDALFAALAAMQFEATVSTGGEAAVSSGGARTVDQLASSLPTMFRRALDHETLLRWALVNSPRLASRSGRTRRLALLHHMLRDTTAPEDVDHVVRLLMLLSSPLAALFWKDELGLSAEDAAETAAWTIRAITARRSDGSSET
jgi:AcrR family transcriptional regulator